MSTVSIPDLESGDPRNDSNVDNKESVLSVFLSIPMVSEDLVVGKLWRPFTFVCKHVKDVWMGIVF